jgi:hypothetical protein
LLQILVLHPTSALKPSNLLLNVPYGYVYLSMPCERRLQLKGAFIRGWMRNIWFIPL